MMKKQFAAALLIAAFGLFHSASASVVPGEFLGVFAGNDSAAVVSANLGFDVNLLAKIELPSTVSGTSLSDGGLTIDEFTLDDGEATSGRWTYSGPGIATVIVVKAGSNHAVYLFNNEITDGMLNIGLWDTSELDNKGLSHITAYSAIVPLPAAGWLLVSGLLGLGALRRKKS